MFRRVYNKIFLYFYITIEIKCNLETYFGKTIFNMIIAYMNKKADFTYPCTVGVCQYAQELFIYSLDCLFKQNCETLFISWYFLVCISN